MLNIFNQGWVGSLFGFFGLCVGVFGLYFFFKSRIGPRPACVMKSIRLIGKEEQELPSDIKILYQGKEVPRLTLTRIWIWNSGTETIRGNQIVEDDPFRFAFNKLDRILIANVAAITRSVNKFSITIPTGSEHEGLIAFDFIDPRDGIRIEILHTSKDRYPEILGTIRGIPKGIKQFKMAGRSSIFSLYGRKIFFRTSIGIVVAMFILALLPSEWLTAINKFGHISEKTSTIRFACLLVAITYLLPVLSTLYLRRRYPSSLDADIEKKTSTKHRSLPSA